MKALISIGIGVTALALAGCTVHDTDAPKLTGPSDLALSLTVTASPETINQDGASQSRVTITAIGPDGKGKASLPIRVDMALNGVAQDFGTLSARSVVTNADGKAFVTYTAPPSPVGGVTGTCRGVPGTCVDIVATPSDSGTGTFATAAPVIGTIRLVPPGVILPPAGTPTASFTITPTPVTQGVAVTFDASASAAGSGASTITSYSWSFGDGGSGTGKTVAHTFSSAGTFTVTLTVTNDRGLSASTSQSVPVGGVAVPAPNFVFSPAAPVVGQTVFFNADTSTAAPGHQLTTFNWNFGDGGTGSGLVVSHVFNTAGTFTVILSVLDDVGQKATKANTVTVTAPAGGGSGELVADFTFSPTNPTLGQTVFFDATPSRSTATITGFAWDFGDGTTASGKQASHAFGSLNTFVVRLTVTDSAGRSATVTKNVQVQ